MVKIIAQHGGGGSSSISKSVGVLNKSGTLAAPIQFNEVIGALTAAGEGAAVQLLEELAEKGSSVRDPTAWLVKAAQRQSGVGGGGKGGGKVGASWGGGMGGGKVGASWGGGGGGTKTISKGVGELNKSGVLSMPINFNEVIGPLSAAGDANAIQLLQELAAKGPEIQNPTAWLAKAAARKSGGGGGGGGFGGGGGGPQWAWVPSGGMGGGWGGGAAAAMMMGGGGGDGKKISKTIGWMNKNLADELQEPIQFNEVADALMMIGDKEACKLLKELEEKASEINKPTRWLLSAAQRRM